MIFVERSQVPEPAALKKTYVRGKFKGKTEAERVDEEYTDHIKRGGKPEDFTFEYARYKEPQVKQALETLFHGKCAYCESRYAGTQPLDVEHWRPKSEVHERNAAGEQVVLPGYHWLASAWDNLFPSCIDCNRERKQRNVRTQVVETLGKANQFPVEGARMGPATGTEDELLINPCDDTPADHLEFHADASITAVNDDPKGLASIRVYALNRTELALDRLGLAKLIEQRLFTIEGLAAVLSNPGLPNEFRHDLEDLLSHEIDRLFEMAEPDRPFSALAQRMIDEAAPV